MWNNRLFVFPVLQPSKERGVGKRSEERPGYGVKRGLPTRSGQGKYTAQPGLWRIVLLKVAYYATSSA